MGTGTREPQGWPALTAVWSSSLPAMPDTPTTALEISALPRPQEGAEKAWGNGSALEVFANPGPEHGSSEPMLKASRVAQSCYSSTGEAETGGFL